MTIAPGLSTGRVLTAASTGWVVGIVLGVVVIAVAAVIVIAIVALATRIARQAETAEEAVEVVRAPDRRARRRRADQRLGREDPARRPRAAEGGGRKMTVLAISATPTGRSR